MLSVIDINNLINRIIRIDNRQYERKFEKKEEYRIHSFKQDNKINIKFIYYRSILMKLDATRHKGKLSQRDKKYRIKNKLCFYCGKPDH